MRLKYNENLNEKMENFKKLKLNPKNFGA